MKKIIAVLSVAVCMFTLASCGSKVEKVTDQEVTIDFAFGKMTGNYTGEMVKDLPEGKGKFTTKNAEGQNWYYEGDFKAGHFDGEGKNVWDSGQIQEGRFENDIWHPNPYQFFQFIESLSSTSFTISEQATKFLKEKPELFPAENVDALKEFINESPEFSVLSANAAEHGSEIILLKNAQVTKVDSFPISENPDGTDELRCTYLTIIDENQNFYEVYYEADLSLKVGDKISELYALPIANSQFNVVENNPTPTVVLAGSFINK